MSILGEYIKSKREEKGLTIDEVSAKSAIRSHIIETLEEGKFNKLPSYVHVHGFLEQYSKLLGVSFYDVIKPMLDSECSKEYFGLTQEEIRMKEEAKVEELKQAKERSVMTYVSIAAVILILGFAVYFAIFKGRERITPPMQTVTSQNSIVSSQDPASLVVEFPENSGDINTNSAVAVVTPTVAIDNNAVATNNAEVVADNTSMIIIPIIDSTISGNKQNFVTLKFTEKCWVSVSIDGDSSTDFIAEPSSRKVIYFNERFKLSIGNAAAISIDHNGEVFTGFGASGQPVRNMEYKIDSQKKLNRL